MTYLLERVTRPRLHAEFWEVDLDEFQTKYSAAHREYPGELLAEAMQLLREILAATAPLNQHFGFGPRRMC